MIYDAQKCSKIQIFRGSSPDPSGESLLERAYIAPIDLFKGLAATLPLPNNPIPVLGLSIRPRFYGSEGQARYKVVNRKYDY